MLSKSSRSEKVHHFNISPELAQVPELCITDIILSKADSYLISSQRLQHRLEHWIQGASMCHLKPNTPLMDIRTKVHTVLENSIKNLTSKETSVSTITLTFGPQILPFTPAKERTITDLTCGHIMLAITSVLRVTCSGV